MKNKTLAVLMTASMIMSAVIPAAPVFAADETEKTEITTSASTADTAKVIGDWTCGASGTKTLTINEDGTYSMSTPDKDEDGKWKISNDYLTLDNGKEDAVKCTFDGATISVYSGDNISVFQKNTVSKTDNKTTDVEDTVESAAEDTGEKVTPTEDDIIGDWYTSLLGMTAKFTFNEDGTAEMDVEGFDSLAEQTGATVESNSVTWKIDGDDIVMTSEDSTDGEESNEDTIFTFYGDKMTANYEGVEMTLVRNADDIMAEEGVVKEDATEEDFKGVWKVDKISLLGMSMSPEDIGMDTSFVDMKDQTANMTFITSDKKTYEVNDIETTFEDASVKMDVSCEQLGDYLDELTSVDVNVDDIETADGVTATWTDTETAEDKTDSLDETSDTDDQSTDSTETDTAEADDSSTASLDESDSKNNGISHATFQILEDGRMKCNLQANLKTDNTSLSMDYVIYLTKSSEEDIENAKNEVTDAAEEPDSAENTDVNTTDNNSSDDTANTTSTTSKPSAVVNAKPGETFEEDGIVYKMADEEPEYDEDADDDDNYTPERTAADDNAEVLANVEAKISQEAAASKK